MGFQFLLLEKSMFSGLGFFLVLFGQSYLYGDHQGNSSRDLFTMNIDTDGPIFRDWEWRFQCPLTLYDSHKLYIMLHLCHELGPFLNVEWVLQMNKVIGLAQCMVSS